MLLNGLFTFVSNLREELKKKVVEFFIILEVKISFLAPFTSKSADFYEIIRPKGAEKQAVSLRNGPEK